MNECLITWLTMWPLWAGMLLCLPAIMMSPGCGCCAPETDECGCILGTTPDTWTVVISDIANDLCDGCTGYNGTFVCTLVEDEQCLWRYDFESTSCECPGNSSMGYERIEVSLGTAGGAPLIFVTLYFHSVYYCDDPRSTGRCTYRWYGGLTNAYLLETNTCSSVYGCTCPARLDIPNEGETIERYCTPPVNCTQFNTYAIWKLAQTGNVCDVEDLEIPFLEGPVGACDFDDSTVLITANYT